MKWLESRILWGSLLVMGGVMFLMQNLGIFPLGGLFWAVLLALAGVFFLSIFVQNRANIWSLAPGVTLIIIAFLVLLSKVLPGVAADWGGSLVLGGIGLSFLLVYLLERANWWALIPMGVMLTLAAVAALEKTLPGVEIGGAFFLGLGATFVLVALSSGPQNALRWAWIPAGAMLVMGLLFVAATQNLINYLWPVALILAGGYQVLKTLRKSQRLV